MSSRLRAVIVAGIVAVLAGVAGYSLNDIYRQYQTREEQPRQLTVAFLNVGQGDAIYIESPTGYQMLVDGGPPNTIMRELKKVMKWYDRSIDAILVTNPDQDHIGGFINVLDTYTVDAIYEPGTEKTTEAFLVLENAIVQERAQNGERAKNSIVRDGMMLDLGGGTVLEILYPDRDVSKETANEGSVVARLVYASTTIMLTGDAPDSVLNHLVEREAATPDALDSDILKVGHHGSRTSASEQFVRAVSPEHAIISAGRNNRYGHPHKETIAVLERNNISILGTYEHGTIIVRSDGQTITIEYK
jgi:competence protein ComEC